MEIIKSWFLKIGMQRSIAFLVLMAILLSLSISIPILVLTGGDITIPGLIATIVTPGVITALFSIVAIRLLFDLDLAEQKFKELSRMDDVTGINNRRYFLEMAERELDKIHCPGGGKRH